MVRTIYRMACQMSVCSAVLCAVLALLASPLTARADYSPDCMACCSAQGLTGPALLQCVGQCSMGTGSCATAASKCPGTPGNPCGVNDGNEAGCNGISCTDPVTMKACDCKFESNKCNCPK